MTASGCVIAGRRAQRRFRAPSGSPPSGKPPNTSCASSTERASRRRPRCWIAWMPAPRQRSAISPTSCSGSARVGTGMPKRPHGTAWSPHGRSWSGSRDDGNYVEQLQAVRNSRAHDEHFSTDGVLRGLDAAQRPLESVAAGTQPNDVGRRNQELPRPRFEDQSRSSRRTAVRRTGRCGQGRRLVGVFAPHDVILGTARWFNISPTYTGFGEARRSPCTAVFGDPKGQQWREFPPGCRQARSTRGTGCSPPTRCPGVLDRLRGDLSDLECFLDARGVPRLMVRVIHSLWMSGHPNLLIRPGAAGHRNRGRRLG